MSRIDTLRRTSALAIAAGSLVFTSCVNEHSEKLQRTMTRSWPAASINKIELETIHGVVEVVASSTDTVRLEARGKFRGPGIASAMRDGFLDTEVSGDTLKIEEKAWRKKGRVVFPFFRSGESRYIEYRIEVPARFAVEVSNVSGEIDVTGVRGATELTTVNGSIDVTSPGAELKARSVNGSIEAIFVEAFNGAKFRTVNGPVDITIPAKASFICNVSQVNGGFESNIPIELRRRSRGEISGVFGQGDQKSSLDVTTINGDVTLHQIEPDVPAEPEQPAPPAPPVSL